ncbi:HotDog domain-containing protein [Pisolithus croceorrhizus]|nr:HotDog domain-containing protein [Pisolithus croceorrhizus]KAI6135571.1 HotDog domain-containing protein [Pisolithus croceorrhizus]
MDTREHVDVSLIAGNVSAELKEAFFDVFCEQIKKVNAKGYKGFEPEIASRTVWKEMSVLTKVEEPEKLEARIVFEIIVEEDMVNPIRSLHGGCSALLIDNCSTLPIALLSLATTGRAEFGVSKSLNIWYHAPAMVGDRLRIVCTTLSCGSRVLTSRCEIWDTTNHRLIASGVHTKMPASAPKSTAKL